MGDTVKMSEVFDRMRYDALVDLFIDGRPSFDEAEAAAHAIMNYDGLLAALLAAVECGMVPTSSATEGGAMKYVKQAHVADQIRAAISKASGGAA